MDNISTQPETAQTAVVAKVPSKKGVSLKNIIASFAPDGVDVETYYQLISTQIMGVDGRGNSRPPEDFLFYLTTAKKLGLDPSLRQIYPVYRWDGKLGRERMIIQTGIDGLRLVAQRSKQYGGQDDATFKVEEVYNPINGETVKQLVATVTVYKIVDNTRMPVSASARWHEYAQKGKRKDGGEYYMGMWESMPYNQLGKCAEALALRKGFPQDLSGIYIPEELDKDRQIKGLDLPTPKPVTERKEAKKDKLGNDMVDELHAVDPKTGKQYATEEGLPKVEIVKGKAEETLLKNFAETSKK